MERGTANTHPISDQAEVAAPLEPIENRRQTAI
jgi:hypothetical protein